MARRRGIDWPIEPLEVRRMLSRTIRVDDSAAGPTFDGNSWATAYHDLQAAISAAVAGDRILVAAGTYRPTPTADRTISFQLKSGVELLGGYAGDGASDSDARNIALHETILSGDIGNAGDTSDNSYHVVIGSATDSNAVLDGFTVTAGRANGAGPTIGSGGGMYNDGGSPTIRNCVFRNNFAGADSGNGGGMANVNGSSPSLTDCTFDSNQALGGSGMYIASASNPTLTRCTFVGNHNAISGGAMWIENSSPVIADCTFLGNDASFQGGAIVYTGSFTVVTVLRSTFTGNDAAYGGAIYGGGASPGNFTDCAFISNQAEEGGAVAGGNATYTRCRFIANGATETATRGAGGAAAVRFQTTSTFRDCLFVGNIAYWGRGGAIAVQATGASATLINCVLSNNTAVDSGGAIHRSSTAAGLTLRNCTVANNTATGTTFVQGRGGGISGLALVTNSILWGNTAGIGSQLDTTSSNVTYSDVQGGFTGTGNINADPLLHRLPSAGGDATWGTADDDLGDLSLQDNSPCIDAASNAAVPSDVISDFAGAARFFDFPGVKTPGVIVDMGAYEAASPAGAWIVPDGHHIALPPNHQTFTIQDLIVGVGAKLDLADNTLVIDYTAPSLLGQWNGASYDDITGLIQSGRNGGTWDGNGIVTSMSAAGPGTRTLGVGEASSLLGLAGSQTVIWNGVTVDSTCVLVKYTYMGDIDLNGEINGDDYFFIDSKVLQSGTAFGYSNGDINFDGEIDGDDYFWLDSQIISQGPTL